MLLGVNIHSPWFDTTCGWTAENRAALKEVYQLYWFDHFTRLPIYNVGVSSNGELMVDSPKAGKFVITEEAFEATFDLNNEEQWFHLLADLSLYPAEIACGKHVVFVWLDDDIFEEDVEEFCLVHGSVCPDDQDTSMSE